MTRTTGGPRLVVGFDGLTAPSGLKALIRRGWVAGCVLFARNLESPTQWRALHQELLSLFEGPPPIIAVDQEGGLVQRVKAPAFPGVPRLRSVGELGASCEPGAFETLGAVMGAQLRAFGFNVDFAPVLDVHSRPDNPIIGTRAFGTEPARAAERALAFWRGLEGAGVRGCGKHFPGHGDTALDSHLALPTVARSAAELEVTELFPFREAIAAGISLLMTAHVLYPALDPDLPATLSPRILRHILRETLGFDGVLISDDLDMGALGAQHADPAGLALALGAAGVDLALVCRDLDRAEAIGAALPPCAESDRRVASLRASLPAPTFGWPETPLPVVPAAFRVS